MEKNKGTRKLVKLDQLEAYQLASKNLKEMYETEVGKKFVHHLIYAFTAEKNSYILFSKNPLFDCLTKSKLETVYSPKNPVKDDQINEWLIDYKAATDEDKVAISNKINDRVILLLENNPTPRLAVRSELTDKIIGTEELQALTDFMQSEIKSGNKVIYKMIYYAQHKDDPKQEKKDKKSKKSYYTKRSKKAEIIDERKTLGADDDLRSKLMKAVK